MRNLLWGKWANLAEMSKIWVPVPPWFTITTEVCNEYYDNDEKLSPQLIKWVESSIVNVWNKVWKIFWEVKNPLLVSVRSGSRFSMPGMMDTILNLWLNDKTVEWLAEKTNNEKFAFDSYRRFIQMYSNVVLQINMDIFEEIIDNFKTRRNIKNDTEFTGEDLREMSDKFKKTITKFKKEFPQDVNEQLHWSIEAVFKSWMNQRAIDYRNMNNMAHDYGTAVNIQSMVFGNTGNNSATWVAFSRNPSTGQSKFYWEYLINAQWEDVVAWIRTPQQITELWKKENKSKLPSMEETLPEMYNQLFDVQRKLEKHYNDMQDIEFTIEDGKLWILQTRNWKRTAQAAIKIATDMVWEWKIDKEEALLRIEADSINQLLHPRLDPKHTKKPDTTWLAASPWAAYWEIVFSADDAEKKAAEWKNVILVRNETSPEDIKWMYLAKGILTKTWWMTSHAAVVARGMWRPCVCGADKIKIDNNNRTLRINGSTVKEWDIISIEGWTGKVFLREISTIDPQLSEEYHTIMKWADEIKKLQVRANADTPEDTKKALELGAEWIWLCRTEHMFFEPERISHVRKMLLADNEKMRSEAINELLKMQKSDFSEIFKLMEDRPVTIRLLDPPLHEFLPTSEVEIKNLASTIGVDESILKTKIQDSEEINPMLWTRWCRLWILHPEIYQMQVRAIFESSIEAEEKIGKTIVPEIMIPLVMTVNEFTFLKEKIKEVADEVSKKKKKKVNYLIGTMIELPQAVFIAWKLVKKWAQFFSFWTNDLTQTTKWLSRDDTGSLLEEYKKKSILSEDPFVHLDEEWVGELVEIWIEKARQEDKNIKLGICWEHGWDPKSIDFFNKSNLNYVSCSPYRVPIARLSSAQAEIKEENLKK